MKETQNAEQWLGKFLEITYLEERGDDMITFN
jgi:hypothetical protein